MFMQSRTLTGLGRLGGAAVLASATLLGTTTGTLAYPTTACAGPKEPGFDKAGYQACVDRATRAFEDAIFNDRPVGDYEEALLECCIRNGGLPTLEEDSPIIGCVDPAENYEYPAPPGGPGRLPKIPGPSEATRVPPPPAPPGNTAAQIPSPQRRSSISWQHAPLALQQLQQIRAVAGLEQRVSP